MMSSSSEALGSPDPSQGGDEQLKVHLLELYAQLESIVAFAEGREEPDPNSPAQWLYDAMSSPAAERRRTRDALRRWAYVFREELELVRVARNTVAHARYVSDENLRKAIGVAERLVRAAKSSALGVAR